MIRLFRQVAVLALFAQGCTWIRPVTLTPPLPVTPPPRYVLEAPASTDENPPPPDRGPAPPENPNLADGAWWTAFGDPVLDGLVQEALAHNFVLRDLRGLYHEDLLAKERPNGPLWPLQIGAPASIQRSRSGAPAALGSPAYALAINEADLGLTATYQIDVWGQLDVLGKIFEDGAEIQAHNAEAGAQNIAVQVAQVWFDILAQRALLELLEQQVRTNEDLQALVRGRFELHLTSRLAVLQQEQQLLNARAQVPLVTARLALLGSQLTSLLARTPGPYADLVPRDRRLPELPPQTTLGNPADLVKSSPEVRLAQRRVAEAEHRVTQNVVSWLPVLSVFLNGGMQAFDLRQPLSFDPYPVGNSFFTWSFGARLTWPVFDGGQRQTEAAQLTMTVKRRNMLYQQAFFEAVRRVQDAQIQEAKQTDNVRTLRAEVELGKKVLAEARHIYEQGNSDYLPVLTALSNLSELERALILAHRILLANRIELYRALGGTWSREAVDIVD
jgi:outer membrane protein TolC